MYYNIYYVFNVLDCRMRRTYGGPSAPARVENEDTLYAMVEELGEVVEVVLKQTFKYQSGKQWERCSLKFD
jgi:NTP pyrophosphatase (non-canonical NTP hydrolase)